MNNELKLYPYQEEMMRKLQSAYKLSFMQPNLYGRKYGETAMRMNLANFLKHKIVEQTEISKSIKKKYGIELTDFERQEIFFRDPFKQAMLDKMRETVKESNHIMNSSQTDFMIKQYDEALYPALSYESEAYLQWIDYNANYGLLSEKRLPIVTDFKA